MLKPRTLTISRGKSEISVRKSNGSPTPFWKLQKIWAVICSDAIIYAFQSVQLTWIYVVAARSLISSNFVVLLLCTRFPPGWFV